jgi:3D (Asp-Asp-Asp) domain-containing protein
VRTYRGSGAARLAAAFTGIVLVSAVPVAIGADASAPQSQTAGLRAESGSLEARADAATLELYSLETQLGRARSQLAAVEAQRRALAREQASARAQLRIARRAVHAAQAQLSDLVRALYEQPGQDPLAIVLGAASLEEAVAGLDSLSRAAGQNNRIVAQARAARKRLTAADARLAARGAELAQAAAAAEARAAALAAAAASRRQFVAGLRRQQELNAARIASIEQQAREAERRTAALATAAPTPAPAAEVAPVEIVAPTLTPSGERTLTVHTTGYALRGHTATGIPTGPGVVAVDPSVIPLGTRMTIPGYGVGIAADTGGAVQGAVIDLWFPSTAAALAWGRRTVTITLH